MPEKWSRERCEQVLKNKYYDWAVDWETTYIEQRSLEFYGITFIRFSVLTNTGVNSNMWVPSTQLYVVRNQKNNLPNVLTAVFQDEAVDLMMAALMKEGYKV